MSLFNTSLNDILSDFNRIISKLDEHAENKAQEVAECDEKILEYKEKLINAASEMDKAASVSAKIKELVS